MLRAARGRLWRVRGLLLAVVAACVASAIFVTFDTVSVDEAFLPDTDCGSPFSPDTEILGPTQVRCRERLDRTRATRLGAMSLGLVAATLLVALYEDRVRRPNAYPSPASGGLARPLTTPRLQVRPVVPSDLFAVLATMDDEILKTNGWTAQHAGLFAAKIGGAHIDGLRDDLVLQEWDTSTIVGTASVHRDHRHDDPQIGWWIGAQHRGRGYATEAVHAIIDSLHDDGHRTVTFSTGVDNLAVQRIATKVGAVESHRGDRTLPNGLVVPAIAYVHDR